jgi:hypothetical protein
MGKLIFHYLPNLYAPYMLMKVNPAPPLIIPSNFLTAPAGCGQVRFCTGQQTALTGGQNRCFLPSLPLQIVTFAGC